MSIFYPLEAFASWLVFIVFNLEQGTALAESLHFFVYDTLKILVLILVITHFMGAIRYYLPIEKIRLFLTKRKWYGVDHFLAAIFGAITPFCSCSSIPLFIGFLEANIPLGVTFSFLITSPLINEVALALFLGMFGWQVTAIYLTAGILIGMLGGFVLGKMKMEKYVEEFVWNVHLKKPTKTEKPDSIKQIWQIISADAWQIIRKIFWYIIFGVALGAFIHGYVPTGFFGEYLGNGRWWDIPLAIIIAVPVYANASGVIPVIQSLVDKGVPLGTALAFMMAVVGVSLPEALILKKILKLPLIAAFFGIVTLGIIIIGYIFNWIF